MSKKVPSKVAARSLHIGMNRVDPTHYEGWSGPLGGCEFDANDMASLARERKMTAKVLLTKDGTRAKTLAAIRSAAAALKSGDLFFLTYSGHGGQVDDVSGDDDDGLDETWCLYDGELIDDELYYELSRFAPGVRIVVLSDSCHSGTVTRARPALGADAEPGSKMMPRDVADATYRAHKTFYDKAQMAVATKARGAFKPACILISGCQDNQTSMDGPRNGAFTDALLKTWSNGTFTGDYTRFHAAIRGRLPSSQSPNLFTLGNARTFLREHPFTV